jgi:Tol biopolymer transport system component
VSTKELLPLGDKGLTGGAWTFFGNEISVVNPTLSKIYTVSGIGGIPQLMADGNGIVWSRDGKYAAIVKTINESEFGLTRSGVFIHERDSSDEGLLIFETPESLENEITGSAWSFDHSKLAISARWSAGSGDKSAVFIVNMNGHGSRQLAENIEQPGWINGNWLFFIKENKLGFAPLYYQCEMMLDEFEGLEGLEGLRNPTISPSGNKIAFEHDSKIYLLDLSEIPGQLTCDE